MSNPLSPCCGVNSHRHGKGRYKCPTCGKTFNPLAKPEGRPTILSDRPLTQYEREKRSKRTYTASCKECGSPAYSGGLQLCQRCYARWYYHQRKKGKCFIQD